MDIGRKTEPRYDILFARSASSRFEEIAREKQPAFTTAMEENKIHYYKCQYCQNRKNQSKYYHFHPLFTLKNILPVWEATQLLSVPGPRPGFYDLQKKKESIFTPPELSHLELSSSVISFSFSKVKTEIRGS